MSVITKNNCKRAGGENISISIIYDRIIETILIFLLIFTPLTYGAVHSPSIAVFEVAAALMAFFWALRLLSGRGPEWTGSPILALFLILIGCAAFQCLFSQSIYIWATKTELLKLIAYALIFLVTLDTIKTSARIRRVSAVIIAVAFLMSIAFLLRCFGIKIPGGFVNRDHFSAYLGMIIPLSLGLLLAPSLTPVSPNPTYRKPWSIAHRQILLVFAILVNSAALFFTMSRGGMFSFIAALLFIALLVSQRRTMRKKGWIIWAIAVFIVLIVVWLGAAPVAERMLSVHTEITSRYFGGRLPIWQGTMDIIRENFIFGTGLGAFNYIFPKYQPLEIINKHYTYAHSDILELLSETGVTGFSLLAACGLWTAIYLFRRFRRRHNPWVVGMTIGIFGSLLSIFLHSFSDFNLRIPANAVLLATILALLVSILNVKRGEQGFY